PFEDKELIFDTLNMSNWFNVAIEQEYITLFEYDSFQNWEEIGRGGSGTVYSAYSRDIEKTIALKSLYRDDNDSLNIFIKELEDSFPMTLNT
ncbi:18554_t:CDS:2, partial [Racocetra persica]